MQSLKPSLILQSFVILIYVALITFLPSMHFMPSYMYLHDGQRLLQLILLASVLIHSMLSWQATCNLIPVINKVRSAVFVLLILAIISTFLAQSPRHAIIEISIFAALSYLSLFFAGLYYQNKALLIKYLIYGLWISIVLYIFAFYVGYITACVYRTPLTWPAPMLGFNNPRFFNQYQLWGLGLACLPILAYDLKKSVRLWLNVALICWWVILFYSASRGVLLAWLASMIITAFTYRKLAYPLLRMQLIHAAAGFCAYCIFFMLIPFLIHLDLVAGEILRDTSSGRIELWKIALSITHKYPWFGAGPMSYPWFSPVNYHPHNSVLQLSAEWGLPATSIILSLAGYGIYCWLKRFSASKLQAESKLDSNFAIILLFTIVANAAYSLVDGVIVMPMSQVMMFTVIGIMIGQYGYAHIKSPQKNPTQNKLKFRPIFAGVVLLALVWSNLPELERGLARYERGFSLGPDRINPRIWIQMVPPIKR